MSAIGSARALAAVLGLAASLVALPGYAQEDSTKSKLDAALELASQTGRPVLVMGSRESCGLYQAFLAELSGDRRARAIVSQ